MTKRAGREADNVADIDPQASLKQILAICFKIRHLQNVPPLPPMGDYVKLEGDE